jgi:hypothetical protein
MPHTLKRPDYVLTYPNNSTNSIVVDDIPDMLGLVTYTIEDNGNLVP